MTPTINDLGDEQGRLSAAAKIGGLILMAWNVSLGLAGRILGA